MANKGLSNLWIALILLVLGATQCKTLRHPTTSRPRTTTTTKESALRKNLVSTALKFQGIPYKYAGKNPKTGFDCSGFTSYVMSENNILLSPASREQAKQGHPRPIKDAKPGDLVFFRRSAEESIFHVSMVVSNDGKSLKVVHSTSSRGVVVDDILASSYWKPKIDSVRDVIGKK